MICDAMSWKFPKSSGVKTAATVRRRAMSSFVLPESGASREMALGRSRRMSTLSPFLTFNLRASGSLMAISFASSEIFLPLGLRLQNDSSTARICALLTRMPPFPALAEPVARMSGVAAETLASFSVNQRSPPSTPV